MSSESSLSLLKSRFSFGGQQKIYCPQLKICGSERLFMKPTVNVVAIEWKTHYMP